jgi:hypothetical protein
MRLQHAKQAASGLSTDRPDRVQAKAVIVAEAERLRWRIWNGKAKNAWCSLDRIRKVMHVFKDERGHRTTGVPFRGQNKSSAKSHAKGERSMNCAAVRKPRHPIPVDCHRIGPDLISSSARLDNSPGRLVVRGVGRWVNGSFSRLRID